MYFYPNEKALIDAYSRGVVESIARISPGEAVHLASTTAGAQANTLHTPLPRIFGIFFNQNQAPIFINKEVRQALNTATDKQVIIDKVLSGYGVISDSPIPHTEAAKHTASLEEAHKILNKAGWVINADGVMEKKDKKGTQTLQFSIATADSPDLKLAAEIIKSQWEKLGAKVTVKVFEYGDLYQNIIATRKYDALLFGQSVGKDLDLYAFWHSSQRNSPGLNVALYVNSKVDKLLEDARTMADEDTKDKTYEQFEDIIRQDVPAIFLYSPEFIYITPPKVKNFELSSITSPSDRFYNINKAYITTDNVWKIFEDNTENNKQNN